MPTEIIFNNSANAKISYLYDASGAKVQKSVKSSAGNAAVTDYLGGGFQYRGGVLLFFPTAEGYVKNTVSAGINNYNYVFNYTDQLGSLRLSYSQDPANPTVLKIIEENHYYPFGLKHANYNSDLNAFQAKIAGGVELMAVAAAAPGGGGTVSIPDYNYKYNGKELQEELGLNMYDYGARNYDAAIGRWMNHDPLAEINRRWSPYAYVLNSPLIYTDPDGMSEAYTSRTSAEMATDSDEWPKWLVKAAESVKTAVAGDINSTTSSILKSDIKDAKTAIKKGAEALDNLVPGMNISSYIEKEGISNARKPKDRRDVVDVNPIVGTVVKIISDLVEPDKTKIRSKTDAIGSFSEKGEEASKATGTWRQEDEEKVNTVEVTHKGNPNSSSLSTKKVTENQSITDSIKEVSRGNTVKIHRP